MALINGQVGPVPATDGSNPIMRMGRDSAQVVQDAHGKYTEASTRGALFFAHAIVTAPTIYSTAAATGGPLLWNSSTNKNISLLKVGIGITVVTTVAAVLGITGNTGQTAAPGSTTAIDSSGNMLLGGPASAVNAYRIGTPTNAGSRFIPLADLHTGALTVDNFGMGWFDIDGLVTCPPNGWISLAASATASTTVMQAVLVWEEMPV